MSLLLHLRRRRLGIFLLGFLAALGVFLNAKVVFADPHAIFFTDRGQEQLFYNVLAALNQADFVEPPSGNEGTPPIRSIEQIGNYIETGNVPTPAPSPKLTPVYGADGTIIGFQRDPALEPEEREPLPRIRVRQVTSDDGDVFYRESLQRRALVEAQRVEMSNLLCGLLLLYTGTDGAKDCTEQSQQHNLFFPGF